MQDITCKRCGNTLTHDSWCYFCQNCGEYYNTDPAGALSPLIDNYIETGIVAWNNEDYRNAMQCFKNALNINPKNSRAFHLYNFSSDYNYLMQRDIGGVLTLAKNIRSKMGTIIDMHYSISNSKIRTEYLLEAIEDFDDLSRMLFSIIINSKSTTTKVIAFDEVKDLLYDAYESIIEKLKERDDKDIIEDISAKYETLRNEIYDTLNPPIKKVPLNAPGQSSPNHDFTNNQPMNKKDSISGANIILLIFLLAGLIFLLLTFLSINSKWGSDKTVIFIIATAICAFIVYISQAD